MGFFLGHGASPSHHHPISMGCSLTKTIQRSRGKPLLWKPHETGWATSNEQKSAWRFTCNSKEPTSRPKRSTRNSTYSIRFLNGELLFNQPFQSFDFLGTNLSRCHDRMPVIPCYTTLSTTLSVGIRPKIRGLWLSAILSCCAVLATFISSWLKSEGPMA